MTACSEGRAGCGGLRPRLRARPLKRVIQQRLQNALANEILAGNFPEGCKIHVDTQADGFVFTTTTPAEPQSA